MARRKGLNRSTDMDKALFEALKTRVPEKNTGPDPDDILDGLFDDDEEEDIDVSPLLRGEKSADREVLLDELDRQLIEQIVQFIGEQTGEHIETAQAIKIALLSCALDDQALKAYKKTCIRENENE